MVPALQSITSHARTVTRVIATSKQITTLLRIYLYRQLVQSLYHPPQQTIYALDDDVKAEGA
jgi:hypothetical protein